MLLDKEKLKLSINKIKLLEELSDEQLAIGEVWTCCEGENLHNFPIKREAIKEAIPTLYNKFLVAGFKNGDFMGHEGKNQLILGFFPKDNDVRFEEENGKLYLVANVIISKVYAEWAYDIFLEDNFREVSMEIIVVDTEYIDGVKWISSFVFMGITVLGLNWTAACPGANIKITKFSTDEMMKIGNEAYEKYHCAKEKNWNIPKEIKNTIEKGLQLRKEYKYGGNSMSLAGAKYLSTNDNISLSKVKHYMKYLPKNDTEIEFTDPPTKEYINYMLWGGKEGKKWMKNLWEEINEKENNVNRFFDSTLTVDKSKEAMSESPWGSIDKAQLKKSVIKANNFKTIAKDVFMLLENGWEDGKEGALKYPVMQKNGSKLVYNRHGLSAALGRAKQQNESDVISKVEKIMNNLGLGGEKKEMALDENIKNELFDKINDVLKDFSLDEYADVGAMLNMLEKETKKNEKLANEKTDKDEKFADTEKKDDIKDDTESKVDKKEEKMATDTKEDDKDAKIDDKKEEEKKAKDDAVAKIDDKKEKMSDNNHDDDEDDDDDTNVSMSKDELEAKCYSLEKENLELKKNVEKLLDFKAGIEKEKKDSIVFSTIVDVQTKCPTLSQDNFENWKSDAENFSLEDIQNWKNSVYAQAFVFSNGIQEKSDIVKMGLPFENKNNETKKKGLWD